MISSRMLSASSSKPICVPSHREYVNRLAMEPRVPPLEATAGAPAVAEAEVEEVRTLASTRPVGPGSLDTMRVQRTFAFVDLSGFTNYTAEYGDDAAGRILGDFRAITRRLASDRGVRVAKWLGDGCMVVAIDQEDMVAFALDLEREATAACDPLSVRIGLATGRALLFEGDDYIGSAVNLAARLCDAAGPGEVLVPDEQTLDLPRGRQRRSSRGHRATRVPGARHGGQPLRHASASGAQRHRRALDPLAVHRLTPAGSGCP